MQKTRRSFKATLNDALRSALSRSRGENEEPFTVYPRSMNLRAGIDAGRLNQISDEIEVEAFLENTQRLADRRDP